MIEAQLKKRHQRIRKKVIGKAECPRLSVHRSHLNLNVQIVDDYASRTVFARSTLDPNFRTQLKKKQAGNVEAAKLFGKFLAGEMKKNNLNKVIFDRGGFLYHGRIKAFAESLRENGIQF